jgi:hypothetical protein
MSKWASAAPNSGYCFNDHDLHTFFHRLSSNRPTKCGKEKYPFDGHCQCEKEMDDHLLASQQIFKMSR